jgi:mannose-6-phosphate isomerase-like protein (cupin superfamily)
LKEATAVPVLPAPSEPTHDLGDAQFTSIATPARGTVDTAVWSVAIAAGAPATPHALTREEVFVVLDGVASVRIAGVAEVASAGDAIVVPAETEFELSNDGPSTLRLLCCFPVGGQARLANGVAFTPPWAQ